MQTSMSMAGRLLGQFREVRRRLAEAYGVDESVALEVALRGGVRADEGRVDEITFGRAVDATAKSYGRSASGHPTDQLAVYHSFRNKYLDDPDMSKELRDVGDQAKVANTKIRLNASQKVYKTDYANADAESKKERDQRLLRINNAPEAAHKLTNGWAKSHPNALKFYLNGEVHLPDEKDREDYEQDVRKSRGSFSDLHGSLLHKR